jgi:asparagine synthase (glutamine-hydrolysing)
VHRTGLPLETLTDLHHYDSLQDVTAAVSLYEVQTYLLNTLLRDSDQMGMAHSIEIRTPFVDTAVAAHALSLSGFVRAQGAGSKPLLRAAVGKYLKPEWADRPKMGFVFPFEAWLRGPLRPQIEAGLAKLNGPPFMPGAVEAVWQRFLAGKTNAGRVLTLYALAQWLSQHKIELA